jgi:signal peptidase I
MPKLFRKFGEVFLDFIETVVIALSIFLVVYLFFMQPHQVNGQSMMPNFESGEYVLTDKVSFKIRNPARGEVVVFHAPPSANCPKGTGCDFIKRILAVPGETVEIRNNQVIVNGQALNEAYIPADFETQAGAFTANRVVTMGSDEYFTVGDNRSYSSDSRAWGPVSKSQIVGRAFFRYWPPDKIGFIEAAQY